ncbi:MAG: serine--tRNA ligase [Acidimicrobiaceae bacterium]|nr:serine--tRNA ligase [Acidimicrobiaceae bacterium]
MLDIRIVREDLDKVKQALATRGVAPGLLDELWDLDQQARTASTKRDTLRAEVNSISKEIAQLMRSGDTVSAGALRDRSRAIGDELSALESRAGELDVERREALLRIPNLPSEDAPVGVSEADNLIVRWWSPKSGMQNGSEINLPDYADYQRKPHWEIGSELKILDLERAAKISGSMFPMFRGLGATLERALTSMALDAHSDAFEEIRPPTLVRSATMVSTGHLPKFEEDAYRLERDDLYAIPTAEVPLTSLAKDEILLEEDLPVRLSAFTACFRREAGSAGRDTRGLLRLHEFDKVEILSYATPDQAADMHAELLRRAESLLQRLGLTYRVLDLCTGDLGNSSKRTFDLEAYSPGTGLWLEVSSVSWFGDYQARRANIRFRNSKSNQIEFVHTLNGSALAWARIWAVIVETYRQSDGSVTIPEELRPYMRNLEKIPSP